MRILEVLDFDDKDQIIQSYSYEVYNGYDKLYWYDSFPHPHLKELAGTFPHHKHIPPNIKHNRVPAQGLSFKKPNLSLLIKEIESSYL